MNDGFVQIRKDVSVRVASDFYFVERGKASVFWLQPRRGFALTNLQMAMFGEMLRLALLQGDFAEAGVEILDLSAPDRSGRAPRTLLRADLPQVGEDEVTAGIQRAVEAYDAIQRMEIDWETLRRRSPPKEKPGKQDDLFDR
jgi:hypothetical protein